MAKLSPSYNKWLEYNFNKGERIMKEKKHDVVNSPKHYCSSKSGIECIQITEHMNFCLGNVMKYIWRSDHKNGLEDLKKAQWYLTREIERREKENDK